MRRIHATEYAIDGLQTGRSYRIVRELRGYWWVCTSRGACYATFATLPAARRWAYAN